MTLAASYALTADVDMQPLDLSIRPKRENSWPLQLDMMDQCQSWLTTKCICNLASPGSKHLSSCVDLANTSRHRPHAGLLSSLLSNTDFTFYTRRQVPDLSAGFRGSHRHSPYHVPPRRASDTDEEDAAIQQSSYNDDTDMCSSFDCVTSWHRHSDQDVYRQPHKQSLLEFLRPNHAGNGHQTSAIFHSSAATPLVRSNRCQSGNSPSIYSQWNTSEVSSRYHRNAEHINITGCALYNSEQQQEAVCRDTIHHTFDRDSGLGPAMTQRYRDKTHPRAVYPASYSPDSRKTSPVNWQEHLRHPESPDIVSSSSPDTWDLYSENSPSPFSTRTPACGSKHSSQLQEQPGVYRHPEIDTQQPLSYLGASLLDRPATTSSPSKDNSPWKVCPSYKPSSITPTDCDQVSTSTDSFGTTDNRLQSLQNSADGTPLQRSPNKFTSTQVSILDFWISKFLWERSVEAASARKPCHFEYVCSDNGQKKIRFRLVDLMELQVEQSLLA
ncbi:hypothetical protein BsWGS_07392 [Bradybaena similaris]